MRKAASILLVLVLMLALAACGNNNGGASTSTNTGSGNSTQQTNGGSEGGTGTEPATQESGVDESVSGNLVLYTTAYDMEYHLIVDNFLKK